MSRKLPSRTIPAIKVNQWLKAWDNVEFSSEHHRRKPKPFFYIFSIPAAELRSLCGISRRNSAGVANRKNDLGIQRQHDPERSDEISRFVEFGYPWSSLSARKRKLPEFHNLRKPGWMPTSIVINILTAGDERNGELVHQDDLIVPTASENVSELRLPYEEWRPEWRPKSGPPLEVIDGQHRLWAFDDSTRNSDFEVPVVAFHGLDISWEAYLFWTINVTPTRINSSLAFDLYPLLRDQDWLEKPEGHQVYREARAQELTELLWSYTGSPWYDRINMLGEKGNNSVSQSAWINSLTSTFVRPWEGRRNRPGGLFGSRLNSDGDVLNWNRTQQAAFLVLAWKLLQEKVSAYTGHWATAIRRAEGHSHTQQTNRTDPAFFGRHSLISSDQGIRGFHSIINDFFFVGAPRLKLDKWKSDRGDSADISGALKNTLSSLEQQPFSKNLESIASHLSSFDWRSSSEPSLTDEERVSKLAYRGGSGYKELRIQLIKHLEGASSEISAIARGLR
jgi:DGQHR domain-containing protein